MKEGGCIKRLWVPDANSEIMPFEIWLTLREYLLTVLKGNIKIDVDPPVPLPEMTRDDYNPYRETLLQYHIYGLIFKEADNEVKQPNNGFFKDQLESLTQLSDKLIKECEQSDYCSAFFDLRWYLSDKVKEELKKLLRKQSLTTETVDISQYKANPSLYDLKLIKQVSEFKSKLQPSLVRLVYAILETFKYYCKVTKKCIKDKPLHEIIDEYCKRVIFYLYIVEWILCSHD